MIKTKYLLYAFKIKVKDKYQYWYETDNKYFKGKKPPTPILKQIDHEKKSLSKEDIIENPWNEWESNDIQKITSKGVCINYLKTTNIELIQKQEDLRLLELYHHIVENFDISLSFGFHTLQYWHEFIFEDIFPFAGELRSVEMSKGDGDEVWTWRLEFLKGIPNLDKMIKDVSSKEYDDIDTITNDLAEVVSEFLFMHPFREGNGRISRLLSDLILAKNGFPMIGLKLKCNDNYIARVHEGYDCNYEPLKELLKSKILDEMDIETKSA